MRGLSQAGRSVDDVIADLQAKRTGDVRWEDGRTFGMVYDGGPGVREVAEQAAALYLHENALNTIAFPSLGAIQSEVVGWTADLLHGPDTAAGFLTSGGTESILCAVKAARERAKAERGITEPEMVVAESAHAAFHKAAHLFGLRLHKVPVRDDWTADVEAMAAARAHRPRGRLGPAVPPGRRRRHPSHRRAGGQRRRELPRRRLHGRLRAAVRRDARP
jgi:glutamate/tyrosine decarboxylase-like PLP-dependent enzyme